MKKALFFLLLILPCFAAAQSDNPILKNFYKDVKRIGNVIHVNDHLNVIQVETNDNNFDLIALNENMNVVWRITIPANNANTGLYKNKILMLLRNNDKSNFVYKAIIIDPATGKTIIEKNIYEYTTNYEIETNVYIGNNYFKLAVREDNVIRHRITMLEFFEGKTWNKETNQTRSFQILDFNEQLNAIDTIKPIVNGTLINISCNKNADMFISWLNSSDIEVYKYDAGKKAPSTLLTADVNIIPNDLTDLSSLILFAPSETKPNNLFYTLLYTNEDKDPEIIVGKMDFDNHTKQANTHVFNKVEIKSIEKSFIPVNKKLDDPKIAPPKALSLKSFIKSDNNLLIALGGGYIINVERGGQLFEGMSLILAGFDDNLQLKFQQCLPIHYIYPERDLETGFHIINDKLYILSNTKKGGDFGSVYGVLDLKNGQWDKMNFLIKSDIKGYIDGPSTMWYGNSFISPYMTYHGMFSIKYDLGLQQNQY